jgi:hypothetical protein
MNHKDKIVYIATSASGWVHPKVTKALSHCDFINTTQADMLPVLNRLFHARFTMLAHVTPASYEAALRALGEIPEGYTVVTLWTYSDWNNLREAEGAFGPIPELDAAFDKLRSAVDVAVGVAYELTNAPGGW